MQIYNIFITMTNKTLIIYFQDFPSGNNDKKTNRLVEISIKILRTHQAKFID